MKTIPGGCQHIDRNDIKLVSKALKEDLITTGNYVKKFEGEISKFLNVKYALSCNSGTSALHLSLLAIDLKKNAAGLLNNIKIKLTEYLFYIRLDQRHDFDDPGRCIPKFSYNTTNLSLSACSTFIEDKLSSNITRPVNKTTTLPGLEYYCLDTGLRETSSKK